jgi:hypothetical protein
MTKAANIPMMAMTTMSSMRVKALLFIGIILPYRK